MNSFRFAKGEIGGLIPLRPVGYSMECHVTHWNKMVFTLISPCRAWFEGGLPRAISAARQMVKISIERPWLKPFPVHERRPSFIRLCQHIEPCLLRIPSHIILHHQGAHACYHVIIG